MKIQTTRFGVIKINKDEVITIPDGLLGFPHDKQWVMIDEPRASPFRMLQSLDTDHRVFVIIDILVVKKDYHFEVELDQIKKLEATDTKNLQTYAIVCMHKELSKVTVNLQGPLVYNLDSQIAVQFILSNPEYKTNHPLLGD
jgi:flagellar assembly factor FliW